MNIDDLLKNLRGLTQKKAVILKSLRYLEHKENDGDLEPVNVRVSMGDSYDHVSLENKFIKQALELQKTKLNSEINPLQDKLDAINLMLGSVKNEGEK